MNEAFSDNPFIKFVDPSDIVPEKVFGRKSSNPGTPLEGDIVSLWRGVLDNMRKMLRLKGEWDTKLFTAIFSGEFDDMCEEVQDEDCNSVAHTIISEWLRNYNQE